MGTTKKQRDSNFIHSFLYIYSTNLFTMDALEYLSELIKNLTNKEFRLLLKNLPWRDDKYKKVTNILITLRKNSGQPIEYRMEKVAKLFDSKPNQINNHVKNYLNNEVIKEVELFLATLELRKDKMLSKQLLLQYGRQQENELIVTKSKKKYKDIFDQSTDSTKKLLHQFQFYYQNYFEINNDKYQLNSETPLEKSLTYLDDFYITHRLQIECEILARQKSIGSKIESNLSKEVLETAQKRSRKSKIVNVYYNTYLAFVNQTTIPPEEIVDFYKMATSFLNPIELMEFLATCINNIHTLINKTNERKYCLIAAELYQFRLTEPLITKYPVIDKYFFETIVQATISLEREKGEDVDYISRTSEFIEKYQNHLKEENKDEILIFCNGIVQLYQKAFKEAIRSFEICYQQAVSIVKKMKVLTYQAEAIVNRDFKNSYDKSTWYVDDIKEVCKKIKRYATHSSEGEEVVTIYSNFADYLRKIISKRKVDYKALKVEIESLPIASKKWLIGLCLHFDNKID